MSLADAATRHPVAMACLLIALTAMGLNAYRKLSLENLPKFDIPYVSIVTTWAGATPEDIEVEVAKRIEDAVSGLDGLKHCSTTCMENVCQITLEFNLDVDVDTAAVDVREKLDAVLEDLPDDCERPVIEKVNINATSVVTLALTGSSTLEEIYDYADNTLADQFSNIGGVAKVELIGGNEREVHIELDRQELAAAGLSSASVIAAIQNNILSLPAGRVKDHGQEISVKFDADYAQLEDIAGLEVANQDGARRTIGSLANVTMTTDEVRSKAYINGEPCVVFKIIKKSEANTVALVQGVAKKVEEVRPTLPGGMDLVWFTDTGRNVQQTVDSTLSDIVTGIVICALLLFVFLANIRTTVIVIITMPLTIIMSLFFMQLLNYSLNISTLLAIGLSVGILVSNSIVVLENIAKRFEDTPDPWEAARIGTNEVALAVTASAGTNVVVMLPIGMMSSLVGLFFAPFAVTTLILNVMSIFISLTLTPILCALILKPASQRRKSRFDALTAWWAKQQFNLANAFANLIRTLAASRIVSATLIVATIAILFHAFSFADTLGFTFMETCDRGKIFIKAEFPIDYDLDKTTSRIIAIQKRIVDEYQDKGLLNVLATAGKVDSFGSSSSEAVYLAQLQLLFTDKTERTWNIFDRVNDITQLLSDETDCIITVAVESEMGGLSAPIDMLVAGDDLNRLNDIGRQVQAITQGVPGAGDIDASVRDGKPQLLITPNRAVLSDRKLSASTLATMMRGNLEGITPAIYKRGDRSFDIRVKYRETPGTEQVKAFLVPGANGQPVPLETVADVTQVSIPVQILREDKLRIVKITGTMQAGGKLGNIVNDVTRNIADQEVLPAGYTLSFRGDIERMGESVADFLEAAILAVFLTYLTLSAILESFVRPFLIMFTLPLGVIGILWSLRLTNTGISIMVLLGIVMLIGVVVNAAVLIIDRLNQLVAQGLSRRDAMCQAIADTFRAVLMVVLASGLGMLPMAIASGVGSEMRAGIGIASTGGVFVAGFLTVTILPLLFLLFTSKKRTSSR